MAHPVAVFALPTAMPTFTGEAVAAALDAACPRCKGRLGRHVGTAVFCPRCGIKLPPLIRPAGDDRAPILHGYANALFRLGRRYERGLGADRNFGEAARCYCKAAKLGNAAAIARLAPLAVIPLEGVGSSPAH